MQAKNKLKNSKKGEITMSMEKINDEVLGGVAGGMTRNMKAAYDVMDGKYGNGAERKAKLEAAGYDYETVQR
ncbi:MAG: hypothetical protein IJH48_04805, partial [Oscillospiraceae bacterium]|nr:hypothetical protein [Oscillospiraceae bacterium]